MAIVAYMCTHKIRGVALRTLDFIAKSGWGSRKMNVAVASVVVLSYSIFLILCLISGSDLDSFKAGLTWMMQMQRDPVDPTQFNADYACMVWCTATNQNCTKTTSDT